MGNNTSVEEIVNPESKFWMFGQICRHDTYFICEDRAEIIKQVFQSYGNEVAKRVIADIPESLTFTQYQLISLNNL